MFTFFALFYAETGVISADCSAELAVKVLQKRRVSFCLQVDPRLAQLVLPKTSYLEVKVKSKNLSRFRDLPVKLKRSADRDNRQADREVKKDGRWRPTRKYPTLRACGCARANPTQL